MNVITFLFMYDVFLKTIPDVFADSAITDHKRNDMLIDILITPLITALNTVEVQT